MLFQHIRAAYELLQEPEQENLAAYLAAHERYDRV